MTGIPVSVIGSGFLFLPSRCHAFKMNSAHAPSDTQPATGTQSELIASANETARSLRNTARVVEGVAVILLALLALFLITDVYGWQAYTGLTLTVLISVLLAGRIARARAVALEIAVVQLELTIAAQQPGAGEPRASR